MSVLNFSGGVLSALGSGFIILCYLALPLRRHFRHVLILNLAVADFINSVNNAASGSQILIRRRELTQSPACILNGLIGQISVQAADCAILAIAIVTVYTITKSSNSRLISGEWEWPMILAVTSAIWLLPFITGFLALGKRWYAPVSGNWCWLIDHPVYLRYLLTHAWRYLFMLLEIIIYSILHIFLRRHFRRLAVPIVSNVPTSSHDNNTNNNQHIPLTPVSFARPHNNNDSIDNLDMDLDQDQDLKHPPNRHRPSSASYLDLTDDPVPHKGPTSPFQPTTPIPLSPAIPPSPHKHKPTLKHIFAHHRAHLPTSPTPKSNHPQSTNPRERAIQRILLLNAYPLLYILLWIPGLANRIVEATGNSSRITQVMQSSTQFVGLANALTYGWNERVWEQLKARYWSRR